MASNEPYCGNCGYTLAGLTESSKCPECGKPLVEVLQRKGFVVGKRYTSPTIVFGLPLLSIAIGPHGTEKRGRARGIIAVGDLATGWLALGGFARGIIAFGGFSIGLISFGGMSIGGLAVGGWALGGAAVGGGAVGGLAAGGGAAGFIAEGGGAYGYYAQGGGAGGVHVVSAMRRDDKAVAFFDDLHRFFLLGRSPAGVSANTALLVAFLWVLAALAAVATPLALLVWMALLRTRGREVLR